MTQVFKVACERRASCGCACVARKFLGGPPRDLCLFSSGPVETFFRMFVLEPTSGSFPTAALKQARRRKLRLDSVLDFGGVLHLMWLQGALRPRRWAAAGGGRGWGLTGSLFPDVLASAYTSLECHEANRYIVASGTIVWERR